MAKTDLTQQDMQIVPEAKVRPAPKDEDFSGVYRHTKDGLLYELAVIPADKAEPSLKTHTLRIPPQKLRDEKGEVVKDDKGKETITHPGKTWHGTKTQFKEEFEKE